jgi:hypothetical protein
MFHWKTGNKSRTAVSVQYVNIWRPFNEPSLRPSGMVEDHHRFLLEPAPILLVVLSNFIINDIGAMHETLAAAPWLLY